MLNIDLRACTEDSKFESAGWYSCCLTGSFPGGHDINWDLNRFLLISVHDVSVFLSTCNWEQNLGHWVVWGNAGPEMLRADHRSCLCIMSVLVHALSSRQISSDLSWSANCLSLRVNSNYLGLKACTWVITTNHIEHWLCAQNPLFSSGLSLKGIPWIKAGFWLYWSLGSSSVKGSESNIMNKNISLSPPKYLSLPLRFGYIQLLRFLTIRCAVHFQEKLSWRRPLLAVFEVFTLQPFIGQNAVSLKKVLPVKWALFITEHDFERSYRKSSSGLRQA